MVLELLSIVLCGVENLKLRPRGMVPRSVCMVRHLRGTDSINAISPLPTKPANKEICQ